MRVILTLLLCLSLSGLAACKEEGALEKAGKKVDKAFERAGEKLDD